MAHCTCLSVQLYRKKNTTIYTICQVFSCLRQKKFRREKGEKRKAAPGCRRRPPGAEKRQGDTIGKGSKHAGAALRGKTRIRLGLHRIIRQGISARDFVPVQSSENEGILYVFPVFGTAELVQKIRLRSADVIVRCCLRSTEKPCEIDR